MIHIKHPKTTAIPAWLMWIIYGDSAPITAIFATWIVLDRNLIVQHAITRPRYCPMKSLFGSPLSPLPEKNIRSGWQKQAAKINCDPNSVTECEDYEDMTNTQKQPNGPETGPAF